MNKEKALEYYNENKSEIERQQELIEFNKVEQDEAQRVLDRITSRIERKQRIIKRRQTENNFIRDNLL